MAKCDINTLLANAKCFQCLDPGSLSVLETQLICEWSQNVTPPVTGSFILLESGGFILLESGGKIELE